MKTQSSQSSKVEALDKYEVKNMVQILNEKGNFKDRIYTRDLEQNKKYNILTLKKLDSTYGECILADLKDYSYFFPGSYSKKLIDRFFNTDNNPHNRFNDADVIEVKGLFFLFKGYTKNKKFECAILEFGQEDEDDDDEDATDIDIFDEAAEEDNDEHGDDDDGGSEKFIESQKRLMYDSDW